MNYLEGSDLQASSVDSVNHRTEKTIVKYSNLHNLNTAFIAQLLQILLLSYLQSIKLST